MGERYMEGYYASEDDYMRLFYHYDGEMAQRLIILNTINGDVVRLTRQNPVSGCYDMDDRKYAEYHWTCFPISENKFERIWETAPELDLLRDRYVKGCFVVYGSEALDYTHYHGEWAERQICIHKGKVEKFSQEKPVSETSHMCDQPFSILDFEEEDIIRTVNDDKELGSIEFISKEEFEKVWHSFDNSET
ncbi:MAG: hypothetical protein Q4C37_10800 [Bacteroidales bacterium]|nr:hypothetical protein [Bacteroidales bacterium]